MRQQSCGINGAELLWQYNRKMERIIINGEEKQVASGELLSKILRENSNFKMPCAGQGHCGKCKIYAVGQLSAPDSVEKRLLAQEELENGIRLACRTRVQGAAEIRWTQQDSAQILLGRQAAAGGTPLFRTLGVAVDIGTTTLAAQLYDEKGLAARAGCDNPQSVFGADVISRIGRSMQGAAHQLAVSVREGINSLLTRLCLESGYEPAQIDTMVVTGNTAMLYLLTERNPECLSHAPFEADWLAGEWIKGEELDLACGQADVFLPPCISAFVGADITTALLAVDILKGKRKRLFVDIGTNGEIALWNQGTLLCCATAAGPAFEGAGLSMGMQGENGAISHVTYDDSKAVFQIEVIGGGTAVGICGSGVIDAVNCLLKSGWLDDTGYLEEEPALIGGNVTMTQEDIRKVQLAKSAICAGIRALLHETGLSMTQLDELLVAGGFGSFLNLESARGIGLLPKEEPGETIVCGNAALSGAAKLLRDGACERTVAQIAAQAKSLNLAEDVFFAEQYVEGMFFE